jgi:hypothetical protein
VIVVFGVAAAVFLVTTMAVWIVVAVREWRRRRDE